jgi:predicted enzyme related to lactoylglutathione lyase
MSAPFVWYDLTAAPADADRAREFYAKLFGWPIAPDSNPGPYNGLMMDGKQPWAAVVEAPNASAGHWVPYVKVDDLEQATASATSLGGTVVADATDGPAGTAVLIADPQVPSSPFGFPSRRPSDPRWRARDRSSEAPLSTHRPDWFGRS